MENKRLIVFDFCETLVNLQTADNFVLWVLKNEGLDKRSGLKVIRFLKKIKFVTTINLLFPKWNIEKRMMLFLLKNVSLETIEINAKNYANDLKEKWVQELKELFLHHLNQKDLVVVVSGGYEVYLKHFFSEFPEVTVFGTKVKIEKGRLTGGFDGKDCMFQEKVEIMNTWIHANGVNKSQSMVFSDSISDLPLLLWAEEGIVVSRRMNQSWAKKYNLKEIIWN